MENELLRLLGRCGRVFQLKQIHAHILVHGLQYGAFILPKLLSLSAELCSLQYTVSAFWAAKNPTVVACNTMIKCFVGKNNGGGGIRVYNRMKDLKVMPNSFTFTFLLRCFGSFEGTRDGMAIHGEILKLGLGSSVFVQNTLLDFYVKCWGRLDFARQVFDEMPERDIVSWNSMIGVYMGQGDIESAIGLFESMPERNTVTWNSLISGLCKAGNMKLALSIFERMPVRNDVSWNSMISGFIRSGDMKAARSILDRMPEKTVVSWTLLVTGYSLAQDLESASRIFHQMPVKNIVSWNAMITGYVHNRMFDQALELFRRMLIDGKCRPDQTTLISVLSACSHLGSLGHGKWIDSYIRKNSIELSTSLGNTLIDMFAKCGDVDGAKAVFDSMGHRRCIITWTAMVSGLAINGCCKEAIDLFDRMCQEGVKPDDVIFISVLSACTHGGLVEEGNRVFDCMVTQYQIQPRIEHYGCMIDLLGRASKLEEAVQLIESMHLTPNAVIWATLLSACKIHGNAKLLEDVTRKILDQEPSNPGYLTLISNLSASVGKWEHSSTHRVSMRQHGLEKVPGCSSIQVDNQVHEFIAKDSRHEQRDRIYRALDILNGHLKEICNMKLVSSCSSLSVEAEAMSW
ncbi:PREDICTED: pentatricopeptide repeat-containing protein At1g08070, chloroplastic-like isoform X1 [Tarenaya hassleriana]|uniref:pentatricopeptide repeat-containing protein At1g08070, chloroplastic-like isoform X1 n=1 Tax=Tarenaya hassleriana TaxID=28532 RepID=UPI00053C3EC1|nr:PREDICTED: pentatricopeptide repeat-containing protein At1g08070, chloroplastic-like isoform X1 [Tarenaya hassleriana]XP_010537336.1 PREDICTED: pentatricopeptide repeat-containing protein At1g08070, chloroplastic-like isoform X1 [Tarenaya hassleriana]XP_010537337.1 PREDICTED: pentatricopeptide repeat-containing protein At1g08070, chloroplastic-like isoform X1 [Tarenaya hassleriana]XP_010537338.1 PREDICTED: pentatricopeptide repeat-containing protein At1g08070, chloroplastic-like isoform X1 [T